MPFPTIESVRKAVEQQLHDGLGKSPGKWIATLAGGREIEFSPMENGQIEMVFCLPDDELDQLGDDDLAEKTYKFRIVVQPVE